MKNLWIIAFVWLPFVFPPVGIPLFVVICFTCVVVGWIRSWRETEYRDGYVWPRIRSPKDELKKLRRFP